MRCVRCVNENRKKRKRLRWQAANHGYRCFDRAFLLAGACVCCVKFSRNKRKRQSIGMRLFWMETGLKSHKLLWLAVTQFATRRRSVRRIPAGFFLNPVSDESLDPDDHPVRICFPQLFPMSYSIRRLADVRVTFTQLIQFNYNSSKFWLLANSLYWLTGTIFLQCYCQRLTN